MFSVTDEPEGKSFYKETIKLYIHNNRLNKWIEENKIVDECQAGLCKNYITIDHLFTMVTFIQKQLSYHRKLFVTFVHFRKAFDSFVRKRKKKYGKF